MSSAGIWRTTAATAARLRRVGQVALHVVVPLALGGTLYVATRSGHLLGWSWARTIGLEHTAHALRETVGPWLRTTPEWVRFSLPDALWVYAFVWAMAACFARATPLERRLWLLMPIVLGVGLELGQLARLVPGTFDPLDLGSCLAATVLALATTGLGSLLEPRTIRPASTRSGRPRSRGRMTCGGTTRE